MTKIEKAVFHKEHHSRNLGLLSEEDQEKISNTTLLIAGCGVGSQVALSAARIGFEKFIIVDGDKVELSNNNRQGYSWRDVGHFKVDALSRKIKAINPHVHIRKYPIFVTPENADKIAKKADIIVDTIDPDAVLPILALHRAARKKSIYVIQPSDLGWGAVVYVFSPKSTSFEKMLGIKPHTPLEAIDSEAAFNKTIELLIEIMPPYARKVVDDLLSGKIAHYPQPISAAYILSAMVVIAAKRIALGLPVKTAPNFVSFDPFVMFDPNEK